MLQKRQGRNERVSSALDATMERPPASFCVLSRFRNSRRLTLLDDMKSKLGSRPWTMAGSQALSNSNLDPAPNGRGIPATFSC
jgi:hypothetical protein